MRVEAIKKSTREIADALETMAVSIGEIAALYRFTTMPWVPGLAKGLIIVGLTYKTVELAVAPAKIVTELANIEANLTDFSVSNLEQQEQVREALENITDWISVVLDQIDKVLDTRIGKVFTLSRDLLEIRDALKEFKRDLKSHAANISRSFSKLLRTLDKFLENLKKQLAELIGIDFGRVERRSSLRPDNSAPTERNPGKNYNQRGQYPIT